LFKIQNENRPITKCQHEFVALLVLIRTSIFMQTRFSNMMQGESNSQVHPFCYLFIYATLIILWS